MPTFLYVGQQASTGKKVKGAIEGESIKEVRTKLRKQNIYVLEIHADKSSSGASKKGSGTLWQMLTRRAPRPEDLAMATKQFSVLTRSAIDLSEALRSVGEQVENKELRSVYLRIRELVSEGKSLSDAHREFPRVFNPIYINMLAAAEKSGSLSLVLRRLSNFISYSIEIKRKLVSALSYPAFMFLVAILITIFLFVQVLPKITKALASMKVTLPWYTIFLNDVSAWLQKYWLITIFLLGTSIAIFLWWIKTPVGRYKFDKFMYNAPIFGPLMQRFAVSRFATTLSTILSSGVRIVEGLRLTKNVVGNALIEEALEKTITGVQDGEKLAQALENTKVFPAMVIYMIRTGEKTGKLEEMLNNIAETYDEEVNDKIVATTKAIQPILIVFMAGLVALIVVSVMGPMLQAMQNIK